MRYCTNCGSDTPNWRWCDGCRRAILKGFFSALGAGLASWVLRSYV
jgi:hypothetical protein